MIGTRVAVFAMPGLAAALASCGGTAEGPRSTTGKIVRESLPIA